MSYDAFATALQSEVDELRNKLAESERELDRMHHVCDALQAAISGDIALTRIEYQAGVAPLTIEAKGAWLSVLAASARDMLGSAENYLELLLGDDLGQMVVTIQKVEGKTPHQKRVEAEAKLAESERDKKQVCSINVSLWREVATLGADEFYARRRLSKWRERARQLRAELDAKTEDT